MVERTSEAVWKGGIRSGRGNVELGSGTWSGEYSFRSRFRDGERKSNPEELVSAGLASCVSMAVANVLQQEKTTPEAVRTDVNCEMVLDRGMGPTIDRIHVTTEVVTQNTDSDRIVELATEAQKSCPVSRLLDIEIQSEVEITN